MAASALRHITQHLIFTYCLFPPTKLYLTSPITFQEGTLRRQHTEAEALHAVQHMSWEWRLKELGLCDYKTTPRIDPTHVPQLHVANFDLPA